jgi:hypothetical protein
MYSSTDEALRRPARHYATPPQRFCGAFTPPLRMPSSHPQNPLVVPTELEFLRIPLLRTTFFFHIS